MIAFCLGLVAQLLASYFCFFSLVYFLRLLSWLIHFQQTTFTEAPPIIKSVP